MMSSATLKIILLLALTLSCMHRLAKADTKVLKNISISARRGLRQETISLANDKDLIIEGTQVQRYSIPNDPTHELKSVVNYIGDKDGYRANYTITLEEAGPQILRLNPSTFKSLSG